MGLLLSKWTFPHLWSFVLFFWQFLHLVHSCFRVPRHVCMYQSERQESWVQEGIQKKENSSAAPFFDSLCPSSSSSSSSSLSWALPSRECFGAQLIFCLHNAFLQALYLCQSSFWSESGYHQLPTRCSCEWRNPPVMQDCVCVCVCVCVSAAVWGLRSRASLPSINMAKWFPHMVKYLCKVIWLVAEPGTSGCDLHHRWFYLHTH